MQITTKTFGEKEKLAEDFTVALGALVITIYKGFISDGASVPQIFWSLGFDPFAPKTKPAAFVHDILYKVKVFDRKTTDKIFYQLMRRNEVGWIKANIYYVGLCIGGWVRWALYTKRHAKIAWKYLQIRNNVL